MYTCCREDNGDTVVEMTVAYIYSHDEVFNYNLARKHVEKVMQKVVADGDVGGYGVVPASALSVKTPQLCRFLFFFFVFFFFCLDFERSHYT